MLSNYLKITIRTLVHDKPFTLLNLVGLSTGLACTLLICLWIMDEYRMDRYHKNVDHIYQVMTNLKENGTLTTGEFTAGLLAKTLKESVPDVKYATSVLPSTWFSNRGVLTYGDKKLKARGDYVSRDYFDVFTCPFLEGVSSALFDDLNSVAISEDLAMAVFGRKNDLLGQTIHWDQSEFGGTFKVSGVFANNPPNTSRGYDLLFNYALVLERRPNLLKFSNSDPHTYLVLGSDADLTLIDKKINQVFRLHNQEGDKVLFLARYADKYLYGRYEQGKQAGGRITYVRLFAFIGWFILLLACINFMNLSTARASRRFKELGIRKVVGAGRSKLILQQLGESVFMSLLAGVAALFLMYLFLPSFNELTGKELTFRVYRQLLVPGLLITLFTGLLAGSYPAFYLTGFNPVDVLKGLAKSTFGEFLVRRGLVIFQFVVSVVFITGVWIIQKQLAFIQSKDLGYQRDHLMHFEIPLEFDSVKMSAAADFVRSLNKISGVKNASSYYHNLTGDHGGISDFTWPGKDPDQVIDFANLEVGQNFLQTTGITLKEGRHFSGSPAARNEIIFNETAIRRMGLKDPVGKTVRFWGMERQIIGVANDFNFESLYETIEPCFFQIYPVMPNVMVRIIPGSETQTIDQIGKAFSSFAPGMPFDFQFLDEDYQALYESERRVSSLSKYFAGLAIVISCLGLFGLAAYTAQRRQKEIGIRKVLGATASGVALMISADFIKLITIAIGVAFPLTWWFSHQWLQGFAYRASIGMGVYWLAAAITILITLIAIGFQSLQAAYANPVKSLRNE